MRTLNLAEMEQSINQALELAEAYPHNFNMASWYNSTQVLGFTTDDYMHTPIPNLFTIDDPKHCGTTLCLCGWLAYVDNISVGDASNKYDRLLGDLFLLTDWKLPEIKKEVAIRIEHAKLVGPGFSHWDQYNDDE